MTVQIKTIDLEPKRQTFGHIARRLGGDKPASRYQEATLDVQATANFHYKPLYEPEFWQYDTAQDRGRDGGLVQAARPAPILLRHLQYRPRQHEPGGRAQLRLRRGARPDRETLGRAQAGDRARPAAAAPSALGLEHEHDRDVPARLRHGGHRALHLLGRRPPRHGPDRLAASASKSTARPASASTRPRRPG